MGATTGKLAQKLFAKEQMRILMVGLDAAGKTTMLYKLKLGEIVTTIPTIGFNVETVDYKNISFTIWDVSGRGKIRALWRHYFQNTQAVIFVVDSNDSERIEEVKEEMDRMINEDEIRDAVWLIIANKQDLPNAMSVSQLTERLNLNERLRGRQWYIQGTVGPTGDGLYEALDWLSSTLATGMASSGVSSLFSSFSIFGRSDNNNNNNNNNEKKVEEPKQENKPKKHVKNDAVFINNNINSNAPELIQTAKATSDTQLSSLAPYLSKDDEEKVLNEYNVKSVANIPYQTSIEGKNAEFKDDRIFLDVFEDCGKDHSKESLFRSLDEQWNHILFLRVIWLYLTIDGRRNGVAKILQGMKNFAESRKLGVSVYHVTVVYFWLQIVDYCIRKDSVEFKDVDIPHDFGSFLQRHPFAINQELFLQYYEIGTIFHKPESMSEFVLPDKKPLPSIVQMKAA